MIEVWREAVIESAAFYVGWGGLVIGIAFGFIVQKTNFCTMGSISDILSFGSYNRFRAWLLAGATAILGVAAIEGAGVANMADSMYLTPSLNWLAHIVGGLMFGFGMVFSGGCVSRNLVRAGGGDLGSIVVLVIIGIFAFTTIGGLIGPARVAIFDPTAMNLADSGMQTQRLGELLAHLGGLDEGTATLASVFVIAGALLVYCFKDSSFRAAPRDITAGITIGLCIIAGWFLTGLAADEFADVPVQLISLTYVRPAGDTIDYLMRYTALGPPGFAVTTTIGAIAGGFIGAASSGRLALSTFADAGDAFRNMGGAVLMGIGGVLALGCTVGQAMTGFSTLAIGSIITFVAIVVGGVAGIKTMERFA